MHPDQARPPIDRLADHLAFDGECLVYLGWTDKDGYAARVRVGSMTDGTRRLVVSTQIVWEYHNGPLPKGLWVLHHCDNPPCHRPDHLYAGTPTQNMADRRNRGRDPRRNLTHCKHGHEFTPENTVILPNGTRRCRTCRNRINSEYGKRAYAAKKGQQL